MSNMLQVLFPPILTPQGRQNVLNHKYVPGIKSFLMPYYDDWWEFCASLVPENIAPNVLTLTSLFIWQIAFYVYCYFEPRFEARYDRGWLYLWQCVSLFLYQTLDGTDGKHARNTKNSSPLGMLFDHGCDAIASTTLVYLHGAIFGIGTQWKGLYVIIMTQIVFYALNWRARHTGQFDFGQFSVDETMLLGQIVTIITAMYGPQTWRQFDLFGLTSDILLIVVLSASIVHNCTLALIEVGAFYRRHPQQRMLYEERFYELGNLIVFHASLVLWNLVGIFEHSPVCFVTAVSFAFAHLVHRLIICDVAKQRSRKVQYVVLPYVMVGVLSLFEYLLQERVFFGISMSNGTVVTLVMVYTALVMVSYSMRCMLDISYTLNIHIFKINNKNA